MAHRSQTLEDKSLDGVHRFLFIIKKDGVIWSGINSVTLVFEKPDRTTQFERAGILENDSLGRWYYTTTSSDLDTLGYWTLTVRVVDGAITLTYPHELGFRVRGNP